MTHPEHTGLADSGKPAAPFLGWRSVDLSAQPRSCSYWASVIEFSILTKCRGRLPCSQSLSAPS
jgi:hypothetical protein